MFRVQSPGELDQVRRDAWSESKKHNGFLSLQLSSSVGNLMKPDMKSEQLLQLAPCLNAAVEMLMSIFCLNPKPVPAGFSTFRLTVAEGFLGSDQLSFLERQVNFHSDIRMSACRRPHPKPVNCIDQSNS